MPNEDPETTNPAPGAASGNTAEGAPAADICCPRHAAEIAEAARLRGNLPARVKHAFRKANLIRLGAVTVGVAGYLALHKATGFSIGAELHQSTEPLKHWAVSHGRIGAAVGTGVESAGIPVPAEIIDTTIADAAAQAHKGLVNGLLPLYGAVAGAGLIGDQFGYWFLGRLGGSRLLNRVGHPKRLTRLGNPDKRADDIRVCRYFMLRKGGPVVCLGRYVGVLRTWSAALAGATNMRWGRFTPWNAAGVLTWAALPTGMGFFLGSEPKPVQHYLTLGALVVGGGAVVYAKSRMKKLAVTAHRVFPGEFDMSSKPNEQALAAIEAAGKARREARREKIRGALFASHRGPGRHERGNISV